VRVYLRIGWVIFLDVLVTHDFDIFQLEGENKAA